MRVLIACEYSARVRDAFARRGHDAWSVDISPTLGKHGTKHLRMDALEAAYRYEWDLMIAFPPCTYLSVVNAGRWKQLRQCGLQQHAEWFFKALYAAPIPKVAIENPIGYMNSHWRKPDQIIQPYWFGEPWQKRTCLWLRGLKPLRPSKLVEPLGHWVDGGTYKASKKGGGGSKEGAYSGGNEALRQQQRNLTFQGIAKAMARQWS